MKYIAWLVALVALVALAQQDSREKSATSSKDAKAVTKPGDKQGPQPLFLNRLGYKSSKTTKESTTLGFNGIDPSGKVDQEMLAKVPTAADQEKVRQMALNRPPPAELVAFLREGGLKQK